MLAKIAPTTGDFLALARYLLHGKSGTKPNPDRVAWTTTQNLPSDDPELAATYMAATAEQNRRIQKAVYHLMIAWNARERPTPGLMQDVARKTLELAGLAEHQALIMGHGDKPHPHLHIMLNRVHPDTGRAWSTAHDYKRFDDIMRQLAESYGCEYVPAHAFNPEATDHLPTKPNTRATYAAKRGAATQRLKWSKKCARQFGTEISEDLTPASTLEDIAAALHDRGLRLERKGRGLIVGNDQSYATFSSLGLTLSASSKQRQHNVFAVDAVDVARALALWGLIDRSQVQSAITDAQLQRQRRLDQLPAETRLKADLKKALQASTAMAESPKAKRKEVQKQVRHPHLSR